MPDIEKRLEAFVRIGHGILIFPGGAGTTEELLYLLGILMHPANSEHPLPLVLTGPRESAAYFEALDQFVVQSLGPETRRHYQIIIDDPPAVAQAMKSEMKRVKRFRTDGNDAFYYNWRLRIEHDLQQPFQPSHEAMAELSLSRGQEPYRLAANLRRAFSGIVSGNVKEDGIKAVETYGPFVIRGEPDIVSAMDRLLEDFVEQNRMKLQGKYSPCYQLVGV
jgi:hypothetical protein